MQRYRSLRHLILLLSGLILHPGCIRRSPPSSVHLDPVELLATVKRGRPDCLQGAFKLRIRTSEHGGRLEGYLAADHEKMRIDVASPLGPPIGTVLITPGAAMVYAPLLDNTMFVSDNFTSFLTDLSGGAVRPEDLVPLLLGMPPECLQLVEAGEPGPWVMARCLQRPGVQFRLMFELPSGRMVELQGGSAEDPSAVRVQFPRALRQSATTPSLIYAPEVILEQTGRFRLELEWLELSPSIEVAAELFDMTVPAGVRLKPLSQLLQKHSSSAGE